MLNAVLTERIEITPELLVLKVKPDAGVPAFMPGQYVALGLPADAPRPADYPAEREPQSGDKLIKRAYSIGSSPDERGHMEFYVAIVPDGALTSRLVGLRPGDRLFAASKITGTFTLQDVPAEKNLLLLATGTGLAPFMSMIRTASTWSSQRVVTILHGVRYAADLAYGDELKAITRKYPQFRYLPVVSREKPGQVWTGPRGHIHVFFDSGEVQADPHRDHVFLCGNPAMVDSMESRLVKLGFNEHTKKSAGNMHIERYW